MLYAKQGQKIRLNVISFHIPNNFYNINELNDRFDVILKNDDDTIFGEHNFNITHGNYNVGTFRDYINRVCKDYFQMSYNVSRNRYNIRSVYVNAERNRLYENTSVFLKPINSGLFFGSENDIEIQLDMNNKEMDHTVNMCSFDKIVLNAYGLNAEMMSIENIGRKDPDFERSSILLWVSRTDVPINGTIKYDNIDGGDSYSYNLYDNEINSFRLVLSDEYNNILKNALDYTLLLRFEIYDNKKGQIYNQIELLGTTLSIISYYLMLLLERFGVLAPQK
jgi:hypothetical protein